MSTALVLELPDSEETRRIKMMKTLTIAMDMLCAAILSLTIPIANVTVLCCRSQLECCRKDGGLLDRLYAERKVANCLVYEHAGVLIVPSGVYHRNSRT